MPSTYSGETLSQSPVDLPSPDHSTSSLTTTATTTSPTENTIMSTTVAILAPSQHDISRSPFPPSSCPSTSARRPKLNLNTSCPQKLTLGKGNTGLRLDTLSASSPTIRNTYKNSYDPPAAPGSPLRVLGRSSSPRSSSPLQQPRTASPRPSAPHPLHTTAVADPASEESGSSSPSTSTSSSPRSSPASPKPPYTHNLKVPSVLHNSPLPRRPRTLATTTSPARSKPRFRPLRHVGFRQPLVEEVKTFVYTAQHIEILFDDTPRSTPVAGDKRDSPSSNDASASEDDDADVSYLKTPLAGRRKRRREWVWTLGPVSPGAVDLTSQKSEGEGVKTPAAEEGSAHASSGGSRPSLKLSVGS